MNYCPALMCKLLGVHTTDNVCGECNSLTLISTKPKDLKFDSGKDQWSLLRKGCTHALQGVIRVLMFGAEKYEAHSWMKVEGARIRYRDAMDRHLAEIDLYGDDSVDLESGMLHWHHVACNALFLAELNTPIKV